MKGTLDFVLLTTLIATCSGTALRTQDFHDQSGMVAATSSLPLFYFAAGSCYPQAAEVNGEQAHGGRAFAYTAIDRDCEYRIPKGQPKNSQGPTVPIYYGVQFCYNDDATTLDLRILYDLYFAHDSGHKHDFEWVVVVFKQQGNSTTLWERDYIILEQDNNHPRHPWRDFGTFDDTTALTNPATNADALHGDHPRIFVDKWQHAMWWNSFTAAFEGDGAVLPKHRWRTNDWYLYNQTASLRPIDDIDASWDYGKAANPHKTWAEMCTY